MRRTLVLVAFLLAALGGPAARAEPLKSLASVQGVRDNPLIGYGLVVGLDGSGDQTTADALHHAERDQHADAAGRHRAAARRSMQLQERGGRDGDGQPAGLCRSPARPSTSTVSSMGNAKSLRGGTLLMTPLKGADGAGLRGGAGQHGDRRRRRLGQRQQGADQPAQRRPHPGRRHRRAQRWPRRWAKATCCTLELNASRISAPRSAPCEAINRSFGAGTAQALDARVIRVRAPAPAERAGGLPRPTCEDVDVTPAPAGRQGDRQRAHRLGGDEPGGARSRTARWRTATCRWSISSQPVVSQPGPLSGGRTVESPQHADRGEPAGRRLAARARRRLAGRRDQGDSTRWAPIRRTWSRILQAMKAAGALRAELEVI